MSTLTSRSASFNPRDSWPASADERWTTAQDDEFRPTSGPDFEPSQELAAEVLGFRLGEVGSPAKPPEGWSAEQVAAFHRGYKLGLADLTISEEWNRLEEDRRERDVHESAQHDMLRTLDRLCGPNADDRDDRLPLRRD
jgi:hypothetical protein